MSETAEITTDQILDQSEVTRKDNVLVLNRYADEESPYGGLKIDGDALRQLVTEEFLVRDVPIIDFDFTNIRTVDQSDGEQAFERMTGNRIDRDKKNHFPFRVRELADDRKSRFVIQIPVDGIPHDERLPYELALRCKAAMLEVRHLTAAKPTRRIGAIGAGIAAATLTHTVLKGTGDTNIIDIGAGLLGAKATVNANEVVADLQAGSHFRHHKAQMRRAADLFRRFPQHEAELTNAFKLPPASEPKST